MESPESYLPPFPLCRKWFSETSLDENYSVGKLMYPNRIRSEKDFIDCLLSMYHLRKEERDRCPMEIRSGFTGRVLVMRGEAAALKARKTDHGEWSQKSTLAIPHTFQANSPDSPKFVGTKTTLEFKPTGDKKAVLGMTQYNMLRPMENSDGLYLDEELCLCHLFPLEPKKPNGKRHRSGCAADQCNNAEFPPLDELGQEISKFDATKYCPIRTEDYSVDVPIQVQPWDNFTKIYTKDPELMYAACNHCNTMLKLTGGTGCGTKSLTNHKEAKYCKEKQLAVKTSLMPTPPIVLDGHHGMTTSGVVEITGISI